MNFGRTPEEIENERKRLLLLSFTVVGSIFLIVYGIISYINTRIPLALTIFSLLVVILVGFYFSRKMVNVSKVSLSLSVIVLFMSSYLTLGGGAEGTGPLWSYCFCILMVLLTGPKLSLVYMGLYLIVCTIGLYGQWELVYPYSELERSRILVTSFVLYALVLTSEWIRFKSYDAMASTSESHRQLANTDPLTKALNRHGLNNALVKIGDSKSGVLVVIDIDHFKIINDCYGHEAGDHILVKLVELLKKHTKGGDLVVRFGGEEFLLLLFDTLPSPSYKLIDRIRKEFSKTIFRFNDEEVTSSFSAGLAFMNQKSDLEKAIKEADQKLYLAKAAGRNRVVCDGA